MFGINSTPVIEMKPRSGYFGDTLSKKDLNHALLAELRSLESRGAQFTYFQPHSPSHGSKTQNTRMGPTLGRADLIVISARGKLLYFAVYVSRHPKGPPQQIGEIAVRRICARSAFEARRKLREALREAGFLHGLSTQEAAQLSPHRKRGHSLFAGGVHEAV